MGAGSAIAPPATKAHVRRPRLGRTRTGCLTCRHRRKKCDERRPVCVGCTRNKLTCSWPTRPAQASTPSEAAAKRPLPHRDPADCISPDVPISDVVRELAGAHVYSDHISIVAKGSEGGDLVRCGKNAFEYVPSLQFFLNNDRSSFYQPLSPLLLRHYIEKTSTLLVVKTPQTNPFINHLLPLAYFDDLIMHAVLALSGQHLLSGVGENLEVQRTTLYHYGLALRHVREATKDVPSLSNLSAEKILHLLLVMLILSNVEVCLLSDLPHCN